MEKPASSQMNPETIENPGSEINSYIKQVKQMTIEKLKISFFFIPILNWYNQLYIVYCFTLSLHYTSEFFEKEQASFHSFVKTAAYYNKR